MGDVESTPTADERTGGLTLEQEFILAWAKHAGETLDPWNFDDAAIILRAETLVLTGASVGDAVGQARVEFVRSKDDRR